MRPAVLSLIVACVSLCVFFSFLHATEAPIAMHAMLMHLTMRSGLCPLQAYAAKPNIIFLLTDDQDLVLDSERATPTINTLIRDAGASIETGIVS